MLNFESVKTGLKWLVSHGSQGHQMQPDCDSQKPRCTIAFIREEASERKLTISQTYQVSVVKVAFFFITSSIWLRNLGDTFEPIRQPEDQYNT